MTSPVQLTQLIVVCLCVVPMGPYRTYDPPIYLALIYWVATYVVLALVVQALHILVYYLGFQYRQKARLVEVLLILMESTSSAIVMYVLGVLLAGDALATQWQFIFGIAISHVILHIFAYAEMYQYRSIRSWETRMSYPPIVMDLPYDVRGDLISISARGRYVDVVTTEGTASLRLGFKEALDQIGTMRGIQVHRSHWVAADFAVCRKFERGNSFVEMQNGKLIPLSKSKTPQFDEMLNGGNILPHVQDAQDDNKPVRSQ